MPPSVIETMYSVINKGLPLYCLSIYSDLKKIHVYVTEGRASCSNSCSSSEIVKATVGGTFTFGIIFAALIMVYRIIKGMSC